MTVVAALVVGALAVGRSLPAEAQRAPATVSAGDCAATLADREQLLVRVRRAEKQARTAATMARAQAAAATARADELAVQLGKTEALLAESRRRLEYVTRQLGPEIQSDNF